MYPLENPLILELIFGRCEVKDLKSCRQVSKIWYDCSMKVWRSSVMITITSSWVRQKPNGSSFADFLEFIKENIPEYTESPFANHFSIDEDNPKFWNLCGYFIKILEIDRVTFTNPDAFRNAIFKSCPNMEKLSLIFVEFEGGNFPLEPKEWEEPKCGENRNLKYLKLLYFDNEGGISWMELLSHFPSLETLILEWHISNPDLLFQAIRIIRKYHPGNLKLKHIDTCQLNSYFESTVFSNMLLDLDLELESLTVKTSHIKESLLTMIYKKYASTLKRITFNDEGIYGDGIN